MHDLSCKEPEDMHYSILAERATYFKKNEKGREEMSEVMERFAKQVAHQKSIDVALRCLRKGYTEEVAADLADISLEEVQKLAEQRSA